LRTSPIAPGKSAVSKGPEDRGSYIFPARGKPADPSIPDIGRDLNRDSRRAGGKLKDDNGKCLDFGGENLTPGRRSRLSLTESGCENPIR